MGKTWTTEDQRTWLQSRLDGYLAAKRTQGIGRFLTAVSEEWFSEWPERLAVFPDVPAIVPLDETQQAKVNEAITKHKKQISSWYNWAGNQRARSNGSSSLKAVRDILEGEPHEKRMSQPIEVYQRLHQEKIRASVKLAFKEASSGGRQLSQSDRMKIHRSTVVRMFENEPIDVKLEVEGVIDEEKRAREEGKNRMKMEVDEVEGSERTPEEYLRAIQNINSVLNPVLHNVAQKTGWTLFLLAGGPNPAENGSIYLNSYHAGERSKEGGKEFDQAYLGFKEHIEVPFAQYLSRCYPPDVRAQRVFESGNVIRCANVDSEVKYLSREHSTPTTSQASKSPGRPQADPSTPNKSNNPEPTDPPPNRPLQAISMPSPRKDLLTRYRSAEGAANATTAVPAHAEDSDDDSEFGTRDMADMVPGGPSSPVAHAFERMQQPPVNEENIDPALRSNPSPPAASAPAVPTAASQPPSALSAPPVPGNPFATSAPAPAVPTAALQPPSAPSAPPVTALPPTKNAHIDSDPLTNISNKRSCATATKAKSAVAAAPTGMTLAQDYTIPQSASLVKKMAQQNTISSEPITGIRRSSRSRGSATNTTQAAKATPKAQPRKSNKGTWEYVVVPVSPPEARLPM